MLGQVLAVQQKEDKLKKTTKDLQAERDQVLPCYCNTSCFRCKVQLLLVFSKVIKPTGFKSVGAACRAASSIKTRHSSLEDSIMLACSQTNCLCLYFIVLDIHLLYAADTGSARQGQQPCCICWCIRQSTMLCYAKLAAAVTHVTII